MLQTKTNESIERLQEGNDQQLAGYTKALEGTNEHYSSLIEQQGTKLEDVLSNGLLLLSNKLEKVTKDGQEKLNEEVEGLTSAVKTEQREIKNSLKETTGVVDELKSALDESIKKACRDK